MELIRRIAFTVAELPAGHDLCELPEVDALTFAEHVRWMIEAGLVDGHVKLAGASRTTTEDTTVRRLTWTGCEFLDTSRL